MVALDSPLQARQQGRSALSITIEQNGKTFVALGLISGAINILMLTGSVFMIQVYDRVLSSRSIPTLIALSTIAALAYLFQGGLDVIRARVLALIGERLDEKTGPDVYRAISELSIRGRKGAQETLQPFRDLEAVRAFLSGPGPVALFDMPWLPIYLAFCFMFHPDIGLAATGAALVLVALTALTELKSRVPVKNALAAQSQRNLLADNAQRGAEVIHSMGMTSVFLERWSQAQRMHLECQRQSSFIVSGLASCSKMFRMLVQSGILGLGAYLAIKGEISAGTIIATSILTSRALSPVDQALGSWKSFVAARQGYARLKQALRDLHFAPPSFKLPAPTSSISVENLFLGAPGMQKPIVKNVNLRLTKGQTLGVIGPSASGKSTLARGIVGIWQPVAGSITLDGANLSQWDRDLLGPHVGYLPQDIQLFDGTIAENIARFQDTADSAAVLHAAAQAGFHEHILQLPQGYETRIGRGGIELSAGQKQRVGVARALYGEPFLVVLDEPNSNLDAEGEAAVSAAIAGVGKRGGVCIVIAHRPSAIAAVDLLLVMRGGEVSAFGPKDEIFAQTLKNAQDANKRAAARTDGLRVVQS